MPPTSPPLTGVPFHVAATDPCPPFLEVTNHGRRLRIVDNDHVVIDVNSGSLLKEKVPVELFLPHREIDAPHCRALYIVLVALKKSGAPRMIRKPVLIPKLLNSKVSEGSSSATPQP